MGSISGKDFAEWYKKYTAPPAKPEPPLPTNCTCVRTVDLILGPDRYIIKTTRNCPIHGWEPPEGEEWQP